MYIPEYILGLIRSQIAVSVSISPISVYPDRYREDRDIVISQKKLKKKKNSRENLYFRTKIYTFARKFTHFLAYIGLPKYFRVKVGHKMAQIEAFFVQKI